ncbi:hypothetical protein CUMW_262640 [Citrus unshiu]|uniref:Importin subunit alpha n=1 Tax=Citrus unshiu TaxID=55188 RepID=A0A2H5QUF0_CITUN|nr:hypothetical protein CUMW_262640 [Citrus unshiu]
MVLGTPLLPAASYCHLTKPHPAQHKEHSAWKDDLNTTIQQVNLKRERFIKKRREGLQSQSFLPSALAPRLNLHTKLEILPAMVARVWSDDNSLQLEATTEFLKLFSIERRMSIEEVIESGVVPRFVEFLMREDYPQLQFQAAWALTNIATGTSENIKVVIDHGAVPIFVKLLASPSDNVCEQAVWALGNVAGDSPRCRDLVLGEGTLIPVRPALPVLAQLIRSNDEEVLTDACWALSYLSDGTNDKVQAVIEAGVCPRLVELLGHRSRLVLTAALRTIGNIVMGNDFQTQCIINCGALPYLLGLLIHNHNKSIKEKVCWLISNIACGNREQIQAVIDAGLIGPLVNLLQNAEFDIKKEAAWAISNATCRGTHDQIKYLVTEGCIKTIIVTVCIEGLGNILKVGEAEKNTDSDIGDLNQFAQLVEEAEGLEKIENLRSHDNKIHWKSVKILEIGPQLGNGEEDALGNNVITNGKLAFRLFTFLVDMFRLLVRCVPTGGPYGFMAQRSRARQIVLGAIPRVSADERLRPHYEPLPALVNWLFSPADGAPWATKL